MSPPAVAPPLGRRALYEDVAERLRAHIFERAIEPGAWIDEQKLAAEYGISRPRCAKPSRCSPPRAW